MLENIPQEMRDRNQWVCFQLVQDEGKAKPRKIPVNPTTGELASPTEPSTWTDFRTAANAGLPLIAYCFTQDDGMAFIDLDKPGTPETDEQRTAREARQQKIIETFDTYTEESQSGEGYHIILKGAIPQGAKRDNVEVYSDARFCICTGNVVRNGGVQARQELLNILYSEIKAALVNPVYVEGTESLLTDNEVMERAQRAVNADKFNRLCNGQWQGEYTSHSEADLALMSFLLFYTEDYEQVKRIFRYSALGQRDKAQRESYLDRTIQRIQRNKPKPVDVAAVAAEAALAAKPPPGEPIKPLPTEQQLGNPGGLIGDLAEYIYGSSSRPVWEVSLTAAMAFVAGIAARTYNISGTGLNQYMVLLAKTGTGKEEGTSGIERVISECRKTVPVIDRFIGPAAFASGQALIKVLDDRPCFVSILGEFGLTLQSICGSDASSNNVIMRRVLLDLYSKSGNNKTLRSSVYSDVEKNTKMVRAPSLTILGESTPEAFFEGLDSSHIAEGLIPRFSVVEYTGKRPPRNRQAFYAPDPQLVARVNALAQSALNAEQNNAVVHIGANVAAQELLDTFDTEADQRINKAGDGDPSVELWNRAHLKALKVSALMAVGHNPHAPAVDEVCATWAIEFVRRDIATMLARYSGGDMASGDSKQMATVLRQFEKYPSLTKSSRKSFNVPDAMFNDHIVPYTFLQRRCVNLKCFASDRRGATRAIRDTLQTLVDMGTLAAIDKPAMKEKYGIGTLGYAKVLG